MEKIRRGRRGPVSKFDPATKRRAVLEVAHGTQTIKAIASKYGISHTHLSRWITWYEKEQEQLLTLPAMEADNAAQSTTADAQQGTNELNAIQEELRLAKVKLACLETLIDLTEKDLGIDIRKKAGTRSSEE